MNNEPFVTSTFGGVPSASAPELNEVSASLIARLSQDVSAQHRDGYDAGYTDGLEDAHGRVPMLVTCCVALYGVLLGWLLGLVL